MPVSSSAHLAIVPRLLGWRYDALAPDERKAFEVALHAGTAPALALTALAGGRRPRPAMLALTLIPPAVAGLVLERPIERRLGGPRTVAAAQIAAGAALWLADRRGGDRAEPDAGDHVAAGVAQALALVPGVSRAGAVLTAARLRGLGRPAAADLALQAALPVTAGAAALKAFRVTRGDALDGVPGMAAGAGASLTAAMAARSVFRRVAGEGSYLPLAAYRIAFGALALAASRLRR